MVLLFDVNKLKKYLKTHLDILFSLLKNHIKMKQILNIIDTCNPAMQKDFDLQILINKLDSIL